MFVDTQKEHLDKLTYPLGVIELWCRNTRAYNIERGVFLWDLIRQADCAGARGGFTWCRTMEGHTAWACALIRYEYGKLYEKAPHLETYVDFKTFD